MAVVEASVTKASGAVGCGWWQESSSRQARFALVEGCDECVAPGDRIGTLGLRAGKDVVKRGLECGCVWEEAPIEI
jgi:hypothetical protein